MNQYDNKVDNDDNNKNNNNKTNKFLDLHLNVNFRKGM